MQHLIVDLRMTDTYVIHLKAQEKQACDKFI